MTPLDAALDYAARGWRVLPIIPGEKRPPMKAWQHAATTDPNIIRGWWNGSHKGCGVGIATGAQSGLFVVDLDTYKHPDALADLEQLGHTPNTLTALTGNGGQHLYYSTPPGVTISNGDARHLPDGVDIRGEGGFVVAPPTIHPNGTAYEWDAGQPSEPENPPAWLLELLTSEPDPQPARPALTVVGDRPGDLYAAEVDWADILTADGWTLSHTDRRTGERHWTRPGKTVREGTSATTGYTANDNLKVFTSSVPNLEAEEVYTKLGYLAAVHHNGDHRAAAKALSERGYTAPDSGIETLSLPAVAVNDDGETPNPLAKYVLDWPEFWSTDHTATEWLCEPLFAAGRAHALYAGAKVGKSFLTLAACAAMATGRPFLNKPASDPIDVLYVDYEMTADDLHDRLTEFGYGPDDDLSRLHYALLPSLPPLDTDAGGATLLAGALGYDAQFVVVDTTGRATSGDENESSTFQDFYRHTGMRLKQQGIGWVRLDHAGKDAEKGQRGSSAKNDDVDIVVKLVRTDTGVTLKATHRRMGWYPEQTQVVIDEDGYGTSTFDLPADDDKPYAPGTRELADRLDDIGVPPEAGRRKAREAMREHDIKAPDVVLGDAQRYRRKAAVANIELLRSPVRAAPRNDGGTKAGVPGPGQGSPSSDHVGGVVGGSADEQMRDVDAGRVVASVPSDPRIADLKAEQDSGDVPTAPDGTTMLPPRKDSGLIEDAVGGGGRIGELAVDPGLPRGGSSDHLGHADNSSPETGDNSRATPTRHPSGDETRATPRATSENPTDTSTRHPTRRSRHPLPGDHAPPGAYVIAPVAAPDPDDPDEPTTGNPAELM